MTKILLVGDTHGDRWLPAEISAYAKENDHDAIVQLGDFGFGWISNDKGQDIWLTEVQNAATTYDIPWMFIDGNHDNHPLLWRTEMPSMVTYMPRGSTVEIDGVTLGFIGGGVSVDKKWRKVGKSWWATEELSDEELDIIHVQFAANKPQIILSHDAPYSFPALKHGYSKDEMQRFWPADALHDADVHRKKLQNILEAVKPELWIHGHYHYRYSEVVDGVRAIGLANPDQHGIIEGTTTLLLKSADWAIV